MTMDLREALKEQYHAGLAALADCVEKCPDELWLEGDQPRTYWRIAFHAAFFAHLYMGQTESDFRPWPGRREGIHESLWESPEYVEPFELPENAQSYGKREVLDYLRFVDGLVDSTIDHLDLASDETGFSWYPDMSKLSHEIMNLRHIAEHVGQLSERLKTQGLEIDWVSRSSGLEG